MTDNRSRVCRQETYRVKSIIHRTLLRKASDLQRLVARASDVPDNVPSSSSAPSWKSYLTKSHFPASSTRGDSHRSDEDQASELARDIAEDLGRTLAAFDHILIEEYSPDHLPMPHLSRRSSRTLALARSKKNELHEGITCDFCGADIFQSFFECPKCVDEETSDAGLENSFAVCSGCYVEGRSCKCTDMYPVQCRPFRDLLRDRAAALDALTAYWKNHSRPLTFSNEEYVLLVSSMFPIRSLTTNPLTRSVLSEDRVGIFRSACILFKIRQDKVNSCSELLDLL